MSIMTFGSSEERPHVCDTVRVGVVLKDRQPKNLALCTVPLICEPLASQPIDFCQEKYEHLSGLDLADSSDASSHLKIDILIGSDQYWELTTGRTLRGSSGPIAIDTGLGWVLSGPVSLLAQEQAVAGLVVTHTLRVDSQLQEEETLDSRLKSFWELESLGIIDPDRSVHDEFGDTICFKDGRYEVALPWKDPHPTLPDNYQLSLKRLQGLLRRLQHDQGVLQEYNAIIQNQIQQGIVEVVEHHDHSENEKIHYLPHHAVIRQDKETSKLRIVYDASARANGPSLNDCLHIGPKFDQRIMDILLRFRTHRVAVIADIEKAFLMVSVTERDRDVLRFLWVDDITSDQPEITILRFARVVFGVSSSPFLLNATICHHLERHSSTHPHLIRKLSQATYVDDIVCGAEGEDQAYTLYKESKEVLRSGGFNLRKFATNSSQLQERIDEEEALLDPKPGSALESEETYTKVTLGRSQKMRSGELKVLGVRWDVTTDHLVINMDEIANQAKVLEPTKRNIVSLVGRFYDPLGFMSPVIVQFKMLFQTLCEAKLDWDEPLSGDLLGRWCSLSAGLQEGQTVSIPRCYFDDIDKETTSCSLCGFCDASLGAYAAVVYLLLKTDTRCLVKFVAAKTRVSPISGQTIPRLELLSALLLARLVTSVHQSLESELSLAAPHCFTDSTVALHWIRGFEKDWKPFVQNRVSEIRKLTPTDCWRHCAGQDNPADIPSRGLGPLELSVSVLWRSGPDWLKDPGIDDLIQEVPMPEECMLEMKARDRNQVHGLLVTEESTGIGKIMKCEDYSNLRRLLTVTARLLKFIKILKRRTSPEASDCLEVDEIPKAEILWITELQQLLVKDGHFDCWKKQFGLFVDQDGIWRCRGRIANAHVSFSTKHPILLHKDHWLTKLFVRNAHERVFHNGVKETLTEIRSRFWIVRGRTFVRQIIHKCVICRRFEGLAYRTPPAPPLPTFRVTEGPPFTFTGVDFAGPLYVKGSVATNSKVWICVYTCCVVRAIHLDLVPDMTTPAFLRSLKRFTARRGLPHKIISDNGKTFKAAAKAIQAVVSHEDVRRYLSGIGVKWVFNIPKAPWWGGFFERMVKSTKRCLRKIVGQAKLTYDELLTAITEVEMVINSRPLSYVSADDMEEPLTPSHLLIGRRVMSLPDHIYHEITDEDEVNSHLLNKRARHLNYTLNRFWVRWRNEYLLELREAHRHSGGSPNALPIAVGDVVVVHSDDQPPQRPRRTAALEARDRIKAYAMTEHFDESVDHL